MKIAYLVNNYPAVSHTFIRREIIAVEALGHEVVRLSIRLSPAGLPDERDRAERERTASILAQGAVALLSAVLLYCFKHPLLTARASRATFGMARRSGWRFVRHLAYFAEAAWIARHLRRCHVDHLHAHFGTNPAAVARIVHYLSNIPYSFTVHGPEEFDAPAALDLPGKIADAAAVCAISDYGQSQLMRWSALADWTKIGVVRCGVDDLFLDSPPATPPAARKLCCVARLSGQKGLPLLLEACSLLKRRGVHFNLKLVGDGELREQLEAQVARLGLQDHIEFAGACDAAAVRAYLLAARALVLPSFAEGLPVVLMEALALGRPVISTRIAGIPELVDNRCGWLISPGSVEAIVEAMTDALESSCSRLAELGRVGRERVAAMHDPGKMLPSY